jgi:hypothetical protein
MRLYICCYKVPDRPVPEGFSPHRFCQSLEKRRSRELVRSTAPGWRVVRYRLGRRTRLWTGSCIRTTTPGPGRCTSSSMKRLTCCSVTAVSGSPA